MYTLKNNKMSIQSYLHRKHRAKTAQSYYQEWQDFERFIHQLNMLVEEVDYNLLLEYVELLRRRKLKAKSINRKLLILEQIFGYLLPKHNPLKGFRVKTEGQNPIAEPIEIEKLEDLLTNYPKENPYQNRNRLILSLIHYQALRVGEIKALKINDIDLGKATIQIPLVARNNSRILKLTALQVIELQDYLNYTRKELEQFKSNQLFITGGTSKELNNSFLKLKKKVQKRLPMLQNLAHWRSSIIVYWLEHSPLLEVKEKLGHRYASSTERYKIHSVKNLQQQLGVHHPLQ
jgi:site-specific recombinase XerD